MPIKNIIFDLGGVFIDIHYHLTRQAFHDLGVPDFDALFQQTFSSPLFALLETGDLVPHDFFQAFREETGLKSTNQEIEAAWNAMLGNFRMDAVGILPELKQRYQIFLLSNTNAIHHEAFTSCYQSLTNGKSFDDHFHQAHYSHLLGLRKPHTQVYLHLADFHRLDPSETLFVDDTLKNIEGAQQAGMQTLWLENGWQLEKELPARLINEGQ
jgi:putative hydrolase of the HAD superfamily